MKVLHSFHAVVVCCLVTGGLLVPTHSSAQYFGQNKVQYRKLDFKVLRTEHFDIYFLSGGTHRNQDRRADGGAMVREALEVLSS